MTTKYFFTGFMMLTIFAKDSTLDTDWLLNVPRKYITFTSITNVFWELVLPVF